MAKALVWMRTWGGVPRGNSPPAVLGGLTAESISNQTTRQRLLVSIGGSALRFRFSNEYGDRPLWIGCASVSLRAPSAGEKAGTCPITFSGSLSVEIPAGAFVLSDAIELRVRPLQELEVKLFFPEPTVIFDGYALDPLKNILVSAEGDFTGCDQMPVVDGLVNRRTLTGVDVLSSEKANVVVTLGDSITAGDASGIGWPSYLARRVNGSMAVVNSGIGGNQLRRDEFN